ncbi:hypothetical protein KY285_020865 [Solanum tuberosum]|nr:hypothetical protein KY285_020865 [Solanum tuberosum]
MNSQSSSHDFLSTKLDGSNFSLWEFHFGIFVQGKGLFGWLDGSAGLPTDEIDYDHWNLNNAKVITWMLNSVHADIAMGLRPFSSASEMWLHLRNVYQQRNLARELEVERNIVEYTQGDKNVRSFYVGLQLLWSEHDQISGRNMSTAGIKEMLGERQRTMMEQFLMKLQPKFESIRGSLLNREVTPTLDVVLAAVLHEETRLGTQATMGLMPLPAVALLAQKSTISTSSGNTKRSMQCYECNDFGQIAANCRKKKKFYAY